MLENFFFYSYCLTFLEKIFIHATCSLTNDKRVLNQLIFVPKLTDLNKKKQPGNNKL